MVKIVLITFLLVFLSSCHQGSSYISRYGQSIVLNPDQKQTTVGTTETISDQKLTSLVKPNTTPSKVKKPSKDHFKDIDFSSTKFLKGNADCVDIIRVKVAGSLSYDELMYELKKRAQTMGQERNWPHSYARFNAMGSRFAKNSIWQDHASHSQKSG